MPTPIEHLVIAQKTLKSPAVPVDVRRWLDRDEVTRGAFFLGHIAPDVQVVSRQPRAATHFYTLPPTNAQPAYEEMLNAHLELTPSALPEAHAAFMIGYLSHLLLDKLWVREIFPVFADQTWADRRQRHLLHNALRAWLDRRDLPSLRAGTGDLLRQAQPDDWLPFAADEHLCRWRDIVADQFAPEAAIRTVEIFANRARIPDAEFLALLEPDVMGAQVFSHVSLAELDAFHARATRHTFDLTARYLNGCAVGKSR